ncbi:SWIM zinc finger family protein [Gynuella sp.]|uniref:SWIM zinc finger family protein n=1 Tax=Gynuella sp. TaxID=2969146 RepID=UPI003D0F6E4B
MDISLQVIQDLAPDQASLNAAKKLIKPGKWPTRGKSAAVHSIWGQCQGSGANPYYTMADVVDHGYKCTCPSRKFPCKHVLALLWQFAEDAEEFTEGEPPAWVQEWLGRRRKSGATTTAESKPVVSKNIHAADTPVTTLSAAEQAKKEADKARRAEQNRAKTNALITAGLEEFQQWVDDQLRTGIAGFLKEAPARCRRIAARLVDAKAAALASRVDELPAKLRQLENEHRPAAVFKELGQLILLSEAWLADPDDADARRAVASTETREQVLGHSQTLRRHGVWENIGEKVETRRDGLISHSTWLVNIESDTPEFALLQDYYPASAGKREVGLGNGMHLKGELAYYPSRLPLRAFAVEYQIQNHADDHPWPVSSVDVWTHYQHSLFQLPWQEQCPYLLGKGRILTDEEGRYWWCSLTDDNRLPLLNHSLPTLLPGAILQAAFITWNGRHAELFNVHSEQWGRLSC